MRHSSWENALFVHWPVDPDILRRELPQGLEPDILDGSAWIGLVLLTERGVSLTPAAGRRFLPKIDHFGANIRTYVRHGEVPGIFFFSLECSDIFASLGARVAGIPYYPARMTRTVDIEHPIANCDIRPTADDQLATKLLPEEDSAGAANFVFSFASQRQSWSAPSVTASWHLQSSGDTAGNLEGSSLTRAQWFTERYSVYAAWPWGRGPFLLRGDVQHPCWPLQAAFLDKLDAGQLLTSAGFPELALAATIDATGDSKTAAPHVCFSRGVGPVDFWMLEPATCTPAQ